MLWAINADTHIYAYNIKHLTLGPYPFISSNDNIDINGCAVLK